MFLFKAFIFVAFLIIHTQADDANNVFKNFLRTHLEVLEVSMTKLDNYHLALRYYFKRTINNLDRLAWGLPKQASRRILTSQVFNDFIKTQAKDARVVLAALTKQQHEGNENDNSPVVKYYENYKEHLHILSYEAAKLKKNEDSASSNVQRENKAIAYYNSREKTRIETLLNDIERDRLKTSHDYFTGLKETVQNVLKQVSY